MMGCQLCWAACLIGHCQCAPLCQLCVCCLWACAVHLCVLVVCGQCVGTCGQVSAMQLCVSCVYCVWAVCGLCALLLRLVVLVGTWAPDRCTGVAAVWPSYGATEMKCPHACEYCEPLWRS